ncbi:hypothetical protein JCM9743_08230 [Natrinema sp. JCM 9743]
MLKRLGCAGAVITASTSVTAATSESPIQPGTYATYEVRRKRADELEVEYTVRNEVVDRDGDRVHVKVERERDSTAETGRYSVPVRTFEPVVPRGETTVDRVNNGVQLQGSVRGGWIETTTVTLEPDENVDRYELDVELLETSGETPSQSKRGFWLLPTLLSPDKDVKSVETDDTADSNGDNSTTATVSVQSNSESYTASSKLETIDNGFAEQTVWTSEMTATGETSDSTFDDYSGDFDTSTPFGAWSLDRTELDGDVLGDTDGVYVWGTSHFRGAFPWSCGGISLPVQQWKGHSSHNHKITHSGHTTLLYGEIETDYCTSGRKWSQWKEKQFYDESTEYDHGTTQDESWYIID